MSSLAPLRTKASLSYAVLALSMSAVVACVTVPPSASPEVSSEPTAVVEATGVPTPSPEITLEITETPPAEATEPPAAEATEAPEPETTEPPAAEATEAPTPEPTEAPTLEPAEVASPEVEASPAIASVTAEPAPDESTEPEAPDATAEPAPDESIEPTDEPTPEEIAEPGETPLASPSEAATIEASPEALSIASEDSLLDEATRKRLDTIMRNQLRNNDVVGMQASVRLPSGETWTGTAGNAEVSPDRAIEDDTQFAIASVTKTFVAALILQLVDEGKIDLDEPFGTYFKDAPREGKATIRQLLSHTSGIYNYFEHPRYQAAAKAWWESPDATGLQARDHEWTYEEIMDLVKTGYFKVGEDYHYSNTNYVILGQVAEAVTDKPIHKLLRQRFFKPLGLEDTVYQPAQKPEEDAAHGHWNYGNGFTDHTREAEVIPFMAAVSVADAAGAIASTADDLTKWAEALYGGEVLSEASLEEMTTILRPGTYGLGTDVASFADNRAYGHRGGLRGYESSMWYFPESGVSIALLSNQGNWVTDKPMEKLATAVLDE